MLLKYLTSCVLYKRGLRTAGSQIQWNKLGNLHEKLNCDYQEKKRSASCLGPTGCEIRAWTRLRTVLAPQQAGGRLSRLPLFMCGAMSLTVVRCRVRHVCLAPSLYAYGDNGG